MLTTRKSTAPTTGKSHIAISTRQASADSYHSVTLDRFRKLRAMRYESAEACRVLIAMWLLPVVGAVDFRVVNISNYHLIQNHWPVSIKLYTKHSGIKSIQNLRFRRSYIFQGETIIIFQSLFQNQASLAKTWFFDYHFCYKRDIL